MVDEACEHEIVCVVICHWIWKRNHMWCKWQKISLDVKFALLCAEESLSGSGGSNRSPHSTAKKAVGIFVGDTIQVYAVIKVWKPSPRTSSLPRMPRYTSLHLCVELFTCIGCLRFLSVAHECKSCCNRRGNGATHMSLVYVLVYYWIG